MDPITELKNILRDAGTENIWRPIYDNDHKLIADGKEDMRNGSPDEFSGVDFNGKTVLDLGCNFGFYSFLTKRLGAREVVGVDSDELAVRGCILLKNIYGLRDIRFHVKDFMTYDLPNAFQISLLINFIGKGCVLKGFQEILDTVERYSLDTMIISVRPHYSISKHLSGEKDTVTKHYSKTYVRNDKFHLLEFVHDYFSDKWTMSIITPDYYDQSIKRTLLFNRR